MEFLNMDVLGALWILLIGTAMAVFMILDGFDLGVGMLLPVLSKRPEHQVLAVHSIWPVWDGNELWGLVGAGALLTAFPAVFNLVLTGFYPFVMLLLVALMFRPVIFELWHHSVERRAFWQRMFALASFGTIFLIAVVIGNLQGGMVLRPDEHGTPVFAGELLSLLNPFALVTGLFLTLATVVHGAAWLVVKLPGEARVEAKLALARAWIFLVIAAVLWLLLLFITIPDAGGKPAAWVLGALILADLAALRILAGGKGEKRVFLASSAVFVLFWLMQLATQFPMLVRASNNPGLNLVAGNAGGEASTMTFLGLLAPVVLLIVAAYTIVVYRVFKGKVKPVKEY